MELPDLKNLRKMCAEFGAQALYLHGSQSTGHARRDSDTDFALLMPHGVATGPLVDALLPLLAVLFQADESDIDLQDLRDATPPFRLRVIEYGTLLYCGDSTELARFHACSVSEDRDLEYYLRPFRRAMRQRIREGTFAS